MVLTEIQQKIQLVEGQFTPSEASDVVTALINEKINFHKLQRLSIWEGDQNANAAYSNNRIDELYAELMKAKEFINSARYEGVNVRINGRLEITFEQ